MNKAQKEHPNSIEGLVNSLEETRNEIKKLKELEEGMKERVTEYFKNEIAYAYKEKEEPFGIVNIQEGNMNISFTTPKKVKWDQEGLKKLYAEGAPVDVEFSVKEAVFKSQDNAGKNAFMQYRSVEPGSVSIKIEKE